MQETVSYDLDAFAERKPHERLRLAEPKKKTTFSKDNLRYVQLIALVAVLLALVASVIYSQITITELTSKIAVEQVKLEGLQSEYVYLNNEIEMKTSLKIVEDYAQSKLGLIKIDQSQITYVERKTEDVIVRPDNQLEKALESVSTNVMSFMEYLAP